MTTHNTSQWQHEHLFDRGSHAAERSTRAVMWITLVTMVIEITAGWWFNSMSLLADGWHMSSHALALGLSAFAYAAARRYARDARFAFGTWKISILAGYTSAVLLLGVAALMVIGSIDRLLAPQRIHYQEAMVVAVFGLAVNLVCAFILGRAHHHHDDHHHEDHSHSHQDNHQDHHQAHHQDLNLKSAYLHVIADAATSVLAITALVGGWLYGWSWLDPVMGIVGAVLVAIWARQLIVDTGKVLLDREMDHPVVQEIRDLVDKELATGATQLTDLHVWRVGQHAYACALSIATHDEKLTADQVRRHLAQHEEIVHVTVEVNRCCG